MKRGVSTICRRCVISEAVLCGKGCCRNKLKHDLRIDEDY
jgi:hypothetical protein